VTVADNCAELAILAPMLGPALYRDVTSTGTWARGFQSALSLYNPDVLQAKIILGAEIPAAAIRSAQILNEHWQVRDIRVSLIALPRFADRMHALDLVNEHRHLEQLVASWVRITKQALGLRSHPRPLRFACPYCDTPGPLMLDSGTEGFVDPRDLTAPPVWVHGAHVYCPSCAADWPQAHWERLILILEQAAREQART
jgi:hypothetical protein